MNKYSDNFIKVLFSIFLITSLVSCDEVGEIDKEMTTTGAYAGDWYIDATGTDGVKLFEHVKHSTYNTSANDNTMWIDDHGDGERIKSKFTISTETGSFSATNAPNLLAVGKTVTITQGQITKGGAVSKGGRKVDKIYFRVHYSDDAPGYDIIYEGHKVTGFYEDEY